MADSPVPPKPEREPRGPASSGGEFPVDPGGQRPVIRPAMSESWRQSVSPPPQPGPADRPIPDGETYYDYIDRHSGAIPATPPAPQQATGDQPAVGGRRRSRLWVPLFALLAFAVVVAVVLGALGISTPGDDVEVTQPTNTATASSAPASTASNSPGDPAAELKSLAATGTKDAQARLDGRWIVQLSAKQPGMQADGKTWDDAAILAEFESNRTRYPDAILLWSSDWSTFQLPGYWVTALSTSYDEPEGALEWCRNADLDRDNCFAKRLSTTGGYEDSTRLNP